MNIIKCHSYAVALSNTKQDVPGAGNMRFAWISIGNNNAAVSYLQMFKLASGSVTVGTTVPDLIIEVPANSGRECAPGVLLDFGGSGFTVAATTGPTNSTAPSTALDVSIGY